MTESNHQKTFDVTSDQSGHRRRLAQRFSENGLSGFLDYEVLEYLLTFAVPRRDTKPLAKELLRHYKTIGAVLDAPQEELIAFAGLGEHSCNLLALVKEAAALCLKEKATVAEILSDKAAVENYLRFHFGSRRDEYVVAILLTGGQRVLAVTEIGVGTVNQCAVYPRVVIEHALRAKAAAVILAHNHPGGSTNASEADWKITERLFEAGKLLDIPLVDHLIISRDRVSSLREHARWPG